MLMACSLQVGAQQKWIGEQKTYYGVAYYPESWPEEQVDWDIEQMKKFNINVVRMAEFSWSLMEPVEGQYEFEWLHRIIEKLHENGISVVLGTPTATPPAWMWEKYPEIAEVHADGTKTIHGARRSTNFNDPYYRKKSVEITEKMAQEFGEKPGVIGWQTDNEFHTNEDYSRSSRRRWMEWLKAKYGSIENLNEIWATELWSQHYDSFEQIPMPVPWMWHHPSLRLDWHRFNSDMVREFQQLQIDVIKKYSKKPITHDSMPGQTLDYEKLMGDVDFMAVNNYHSFEAYDRVISNYDRMRGYGKGYHWLFETAPNNSGGGKQGKTWFLHQPDGSMRAILWSNYALGGQGTMFWLWRQHRAGHEMPHGSFISAWGKPAANHEELTALGQELRDQSDFLMENPVAPAKMAIMYSHEADQGLRIEQMANDIRYYTDWTYRFYLAFHDAFLHRDVLAPSHDISDYKVLFIPIMPIVPDELRERLEAWVKGGGTLLIGPMSGYRSEYWAAFTDHATGSLEDWMGLTVESRIPIGAKLRPAEIPVMLDFDAGLALPEAEGGLWSEALTTEEGKVLATYQNGMHSGEAAIVETQVGKGKVVYLGTDPGREALAKMLLNYAEEAGIAPLASGDKGVLMVPREGKAGKAVVVINLMNKTATVELKQLDKAKDLLTGEQLGKRLELAPYEVRILE